MSFKLINPIDGTDVDIFQRGEHVDLTAAISIYVEPISTAIIPHPEILDLMPGAYCIMGVAGEFMAKTLIVPVEHYHYKTHTLLQPGGRRGTGYLDGPLATPVFNFGSQRVRIEKGSVISRMVAL